MMIEDPWHPLYSLLLLLMNNYYLLASVPLALLRQRGAVDEDGDTHWTNALL